MPLIRDGEPPAAVQRGLPGVSAEEGPLPSEQVLSGELLGEPGQGFVNFLKTLDSGRIGIGALARCA